LTNPSFVQKISSKIFQQIRPPNVQIFSRLPLHIIIVHPQQRSQAKAGFVIFVGEGGSVAAAGLVAAHRQHCGVVVPANASGGCRGFHAVYLLCFSVLEFAFVCLFHSRRMATLGDCPQFVSMVNSAIQVVLSPKTISNEGMSNCFKSRFFPRYLL